MKENIIKKQKVGNLKMAMGKHFDKMKERAGLLELEEDSEEDRETTQAFQRLRPGAKTDLSTHMQARKHPLKITSRILTRDGPTKKNQQSQKLLSLEARAQFLKDT